MIWRTKPAISPGRTRHDKTAHSYLDGHEPRQLLSSRRKEVHLRKLLAACSAILGAVAVLTTFALPASASTAPHLAGPANQLTGAERAALPRTYFFKVASASPAFSAAPAISAVPAALPINSSFDFCNSNIACFDATLHYVSRTRFQIESAQLIDSLCDNRSVFADVYDQNGFLGEFRNSEGCHNAADFPTETLTDSGGVSFVQMHLYACNTLSCSSIVLSLKHGNPDF
jgi:hypothetical protein